MRMLPLLIAAVLVAACSNTVPASNTEAAAATNDGAIDTIAENSHPEASGIDEASANDAAEAAAVAHDAAPVAKGVQPQQATTVANLPLRRGFYVASDTSCGQASNATLMLVRRAGVNASRVPCDFKRIEKLGPTTFRVTEACSSGGAA